MFYVEEKFRRVYVVKFFLQIQFNVIRAPIKNKNTNCMVFVFDVTRNLTHDLWHLRKA
jgi:hypothetical protein